MDIEDRYARHRLIDGWDQDRLARAAVMVAGAGAIGNEVIKLLALLGFGSILIVDFDAVEITNLTRSLLFREADIGRPKAEVAAERAREINPQITVRALQGDLEYDIGLGVVRSMDLVIGCLDSLDARLALNRACMRAQTPWLNGAIEVTVAEVSLFRNDSGACFECGMSAEMWERRSVRYSCSGLRSTAPEAKVPTTAVVASIAASYLVQEALTLLHAGGPKEAEEKEGLGWSRKITINLKPYETAIYTLSRSPDCLAHEAWEPIEIRRELPTEATAVDMLGWAGSPRAVVELGFDLVTEMRCAVCGAAEPYRMPVSLCEDRLMLCPNCGTDTRSLETVNWLDADHPLSRTVLAELGVPDHQVLCVKDAGIRRYYQLGGAPLWESPDAS